MPDALNPVFILVALGGFVLGALVFAWIGQRRARAAAEEARLRLEPDLVALREQRDALARQHEDARSLAERLERDRGQIEQRQQAALAVAAERKAEVEGLRSRLAEADARHATASADLHALGARHAALEAGSAEQARAAAEKLALLEQADQRLREAFQNLAQQILEAKAERFREQSAEQLGGLLDPLKLQLKEFREAVTQTHANEQRERGMLVQEIRSLKDLNLQISQDAINLTRALKGDTQAQGAWGEMVLERVLEASGLQAGREYELQSSFTDDDGRRQRPDAIVRLPEDKVVIIDAKVSLVAWERSVASHDPGERETALREHLQSLRRHIDGLSGRNYSDIDGVRTLDFVLMFVPVEAAFIEAVRLDANLYSHALAKNISLISPSTLLATLRTIAHLWRIEQRNENAKEIARRAANLHDNFALLVGELENLGAQLDKAQGAQRSAIRRLTEGGKGSVMLQVNSLAAMGVATKRALPGNLLDAAAATDSDEPGEA
ncbi:MAG: DNA recombination protein RmuC [Xanthomonadales bacterium]|nr:DNA recombination protein RmuC [Xanthomonadales bacterium]